MTGEWRKVPIGELAEIFDGPHATPPKTSHGPIFLGISNLVQGRLDLANTEHLAEEDYERWTRRVEPQAGDVVFSYETRLGEAAFIPPGLRFCLGRRMGLLRARPGKVDKRFLLYAYLGPRFQETLRARTIHGSTVDRIPLIDMPRFPIEVPDSADDQRAIAHILGTLDDKIELNRRMSETLEAMARALFKSWFVDFDPVRAKAQGRDPGLPKPLADLFPDRLANSELGEIPEGWEVGPLSQFFDVALGGAWGEDEQSTRATVAVRCLRGIDCHDLAEGRIPDVPVRWVSPRQAADRELPEGAILIEGSGSFCGRSMIWRRDYGELLGGTVGYSNFCKRLEPRCTAAQAGICWMQMRQAYRDGLLQSFRTGTAFPNFDVHGALSNLIVAVPPVPLAEAFGEMFALSQRLDLMVQSRTLAALRDALLPKLISGELRAPDMEFLLASALPKSTEEGA